jgi:membrane AbrB-like protein
MKSNNSIIMAFFAGTLGSLFGWGLALPAPFLMGPVIVSTLFAILRIGFLVPEQIKQISFILIGISVGSNVTPEALLSISRWPLSILIMILSVITIILLCKKILQNFFGMDKKSSLLASTPGHLSFVLMLGTETKADTTKIAIIQSIRVLALTIITPVIVVLYSGSELNDANLQREIMNSGGLVVLCLLSIIGGLLLKVLNFPAPFLIGAMLISALSHGTNLTPGYVPNLLEGIAFAILGTVIGARFVGVEMKSLKSCLVSGLTITLAGVFICFLATSIIYKITGIPFIHIFIAIAPGGLETMVAMGGLVDAEPTYVAFHHVMRLFFIALLIPIVLKKII